jgi:hypothetical protein
MRYDPLKFKDVQTSHILSPELHGVRSLMMKDLSEKFGATRGVFSKCLQVRLG